jgi:hypothetical protein
MSIDPARRALLAMALGAFGIATGEFVTLAWIFHGCDRGGPLVGGPAF